MALNKAPSLLDDPSLGLLLIKNALRPIDRCHLNEIKTDNLFINAIHFALEGALCAYVVKEHFRTLRRKFGTNDTHGELLVEECSTLKTWGAEVKGTMKETLEFVDKFQADFDAALAYKLSLENQAKFVKD